MKIALDIMSGDCSPSENIIGAVNFIKSPISENFSITLLGSKQAISSNKNKFSFLGDRISYIYTTQVVSSEDRASRVFKQKPDSSMIKGISLLKDKKVDALVSSGITGCLFASSLLLLGKLENIMRPALAAYIPRKKGGFVLCDVGANSNNKPIHLLQFAQMSSAYIKYLENVKNPKTALLNIGEEANKGNELSIEAYNILNEKLDNFIGNIESRYIFENKADIIICDGFTGNIVLKLIEGTVNKMISWTTESINAHSISKLAKPMLYPVFKDIKKSFDYEEHGGTPLLGVNGIIIKCHGSSNSKAIENGLFKAKKCIDRKFLNKIKKAL